jgi:hypothetical protein
MKMNGNRPMERKKKNSRQKWMAKIAQRRDSVIVAQAKNMIQRWQKQLSVSIEVWFCLLSHFSKRNKRNG